MRREGARRAHRACATFRPLSSALACALLALACNTGDRAAAPRPDPAASALARSPSSYASGAFTTSGTSTAVCQHRGCWMEITDAAGEAHVRVAGHAFAIPRAASGKRARVLATLVRADAPGAACAEHGEGASRGAPGDAPGAGKKGASCADEAEAQTGHPLAKLQLEATGVEILD